MLNENEEIDFSNFSANPTQTQQETPAVASPFSELPPTSEAFKVKFSPKLIAMMVLVGVLIIIQVIIYFISQPPKPVRKTTSYETNTKS